MSHHVSATASNPTGAVEVVRVPSSSTTTAPVDPGSAAGSAGAVAPAAAPTSTPVSSVVSGATPTAGQSGTPGANLPVDTIEQASNTIQNAQADLSVTAGAERRLDGFDLVGGGGGGGGEAGAGQENANNAEGAVAQGTADQDVSETGIGGERDAVGQQADLTTSLDQDGNVVGEANNAGTGLPDTDERSQALA
jgi:hypothetical protein